MIFNERTIKRVAFIGQKGIPAEFPGTSGVEFYTQWLAEKLSSKGVETYCYVRYWATPAKLKHYHNITLVHLPSVPSLYLDAISHSFFCSFHVCITPIDTVWYQGIGPAFFSFIPKLFGKKIVLTVHSLDWQRSKWNSMGKLFLRLSERIAIANADYIHTVSRQIQLYLDRIYQRKSNIIRMQIKKNPLITKSDLKKMYRLKPNRYLLFIGRFVPEKRIEWIIRAFTKARHSSTKLVIAGGSLYSREYEQRIRSLAKGNHNILFVGYVLGKKKSALLANCKALILPSSIEGFPIVVSEAIAYHKKCLIGDYLKEEYSREYKNIMFFKSNDYQDFSKKLQKLLVK